MAVSLVRNRKAFARGLNLDTTLPSKPVPLQSPSAGESDSGSVSITILICFLLLLSVVLVFGQSLGHPFVNYDDPEYVSANEHVISGLTPESIRWAFTHRHSNNWHPLTSMSHMVDCGVFGAWAGGHHLTNMLLHAATATALFFFLREATGHLWPGAFVAALFAIHPLHVESVAWVSERKDVLSGLCFTLTLMAYCSYSQRTFSMMRYFLVALLFALGLLAKPMLVTLPILLLLLDYWPLGRFHSTVSPNSAGEDAQIPRSARFPWSLVVEKTPLLAISALVSLGTMWVQRDSAFPLDVLPLGQRLAHMAISYIVYLWQMLYPVGLAAFYPYPEKGDTLSAAIIAGGILTGITLLAFSWRREHPYFIVGWLWYLVTLLPVIGLVQVGLQSMADRYTYLPGVGPYIVFAWGGWEFSTARRWRKWKLGAVAALVLAVLMVVANIQASYWQSGVALWQHAVQCTTRNACALANLADALRDEKRFSQAAENYEKSLEINPKYPEGYDHLVLSLCKSGRLDQSITGYCQALKTKQGNLPFFRNLGLSLVRAGQIDKAIELWLEELNRPTPDELAILNDIAWLRATHPDKALRNGQEALKLARQVVQESRGQIPETLDTLAAAYAEGGQFTAALEACRQAIALTTAQHRSGLAAAIQKRLDGYREGIPFRELPQDFPQRWSINTPRRPATVNK